MPLTPDRAYELAERARGAEWLKILRNHLKIRDAIGAVDEPKGGVLMDALTVAQMRLKAEWVDSLLLDVGIVNEADLRKAVQNAAFS